MGTNAEHESNPRKRKQRRNYTPSRKLEGLENGISSVSSGTEAEQRGNQG
jgi:hypothetical protein